METQGRQSRRMVILAAAFVLMTLLIFCGSNNVIEEVYSNFHVAINNAPGTTNLKKWPWKGGYVPVHGNKVLPTFRLLVLILNNTNAPIDLRWSSSFSRICLCVATTVHC